MGNGKTVTETEVFYHALYHHVAHWTAYIAMMGVLITVGALLSVGSVPTSGNHNLRTFGIICATLAAWLGAMYFIRGMMTYGGIVNDMLPTEHLKRTQTFPHKITVLIGAIAATFFAALDIVLIFI